MTPTFPFAAHVDKFNWFCHMWNHMQPHLYNNETHLEYEMTLNKAFAEVSDDRDAPVRSD